MMQLNEKLQAYAQIIVEHGLNIQQGQLVNIAAEAYHREFVYIIAESAYNLGARYVNVDLIEPRIGKIRLLKSKEQDLSYVPSFISTKYQELLSSNAANLRLVGSEYPDLLANLDPKKINTVRFNNYLAVKPFYDEGIGKSLIHWTVAAAATPLWGKKIFPDLSEEQACLCLWEEIFKICRINDPDPIRRWKEHDQSLQQRAQKLTNLKIKTLHFIGPETDLTVRLSPKAKFKGGGDQGPKGVYFEPNIPTEEVFTTPDYRGTNGKVRATRPFFVNGKLIEGLSLTFKEGEIVNFSSSSGSDTFAEYINSDPGAKRLGEVALVGIDSPVFQSGLVFQEILYDENAACHIAVGSAYKFCLEDGDTMTKEELIEIGCNESSVHTDMMISSELVDVIAETYEGKKITLISKGQWL